MIKLYLLYYLLLLLLKTEFIFVVNHIGAKPKIRAELKPKKLVSITKCIKLNMLFRLLTLS